MNVNGYGIGRCNAAEKRFFMNVRAKKNLKNDRYVYCVCAFNTDPQTTHTMRHLIKA